MNNYLALLIYLGLGFIVGFLYRTILKKFAKNSPHGLTKNIGKSDRWMRTLLGIALLVWAVLTNWSPVLIAASGFCFFEAMFSWCGFYAAIGKTTCPIE